MAEDKQELDDELKRVLKEKEKQEKLKKENN